MNDVQGMRRLGSWVGLVWLLLAAVSVGFAQDTVDDPKEACSIRHLKDAVGVGEYTFRTFRSGDYNADNCLQVIKDHRVIFRRTLNSMQGYTLGQPEDKKLKIPEIPNGADITGRGRKDMIVSFSTGGAHCCLMHYVFELEPEFKLVAKLDARDTWPAYFTDLDHDAHYYYIAEDWTFAYWPGSFAGSPNHSVVLKFVDDANGGGYHLALDKMTTPPPTPTVWAKNLEDVRQEQQLEDTGWYNNLEGVLWQNILDLLYTSHSDLAWKFLEESRRTAKNLGPVHTTLVGGDGSQFFSSQGVRSDGYRVYPSDDGRRGGENWPRPCGLRRNSGHTLLSA